MCREFHSLPTAGGLLDQDSVLVRGIAITMGAMAEREKKDMEDMKSKAKAKR